MVRAPGTATTPCQPPPLRYRVLSRLLWPALAGLSWHQGRAAGDVRLLPQRLAYQLPDGPTEIWCHCASVGEVNTAAPLINALRQRGHRVHLTTVTPTGAETVRKTWGDAVSHSYLPIDTAAATGRFLAALRPTLGLVVETEIWPNLYAQARARGVTLAIVNGRVSPRTANAPRWWRPVMASALQHLHRVLARSERDAAAWRTLGVPPKRIQVTGSLKYAALATATTEQPRLCAVPYWLVASTHADEEQQIAAAWQAATARTRHTLVIVPRHVGRAVAIRRQLTALGLRVATRSLGETEAASPDVILADTFGELQAWYHYADAVFVGGSFVDTGGHNVLEPAVHAKWIATGPTVHNFQDEVDLLRQANAIACVSTPQALVSQVCEVLAQPELAQAQGERARAAVAEVADVLPRYLDGIAALYAASNATQPASS
ncbi:MAG: glycosyltransferase N-terminal domain-containing protein [Pseudomonadota bacterium]